MNPTPPIAPPSVADARPPPIALLVLLGGLGALAFAVLSRPGIEGLVADDAIYLLAADYIAPYDAAVSESARFILQHNRFPPLFPALLGVLGAGASAPVAAHLVAGALVVLAVTVAARWYSRELGSWPFGVVLAAWVALAPITVMHVIDVWSEHLYLLITLAALAFNSGRSASPASRWGLAALVALALLTRSIGVSLLLAFAVTAWRRDGRAAIAPVLAAAALPLAWGVVNPFEDSTGGYASQFFDGFRDFSLGTLMLQLQHKPDSLASAWHGAFDHVGAIPGAVTAAFAVAASAGWLLRLRQGRLDALYFGLYVGLVAIWPSRGHDSRFLYPVFPIAVLYMGLAVAAGARRLGLRETHGVAALVLALVLGSTPSVVYVASRLTNPPEGDLAPFGRTVMWLDNGSAAVALHNMRLVQHLTGALRLAGSHVPPGACVTAAHPELFMFHARRLSFVPPHPAADDAAFAAGIGRCRYVFVSAIDNHPVFPPSYPEQRLAAPRTVFATRIVTTTGPVVATALFELE